MVEIIASKSVELIVHYVNSFQYKEDILFQALRDYSTKLAKEEVGYAWENDTYKASDLEVFMKPIKNNMIY